MKLVFWLSWVMLGTAVLAAVWRLWRGPTVVDRMLAFDLIATCVVAWIAILSLQAQSELFVELILVYSLLGFLTTVTLALYLHSTIPRRSAETRSSSEGDLEND
ncbi:MAG: monovalent cation/H+ antiporter complex subunit F [Verrucomicrobiota bacterium]|nr:monovalent cation/H+ antiporter complex subunit F [Limisphaera sp.]MDW8382154.1 monovalent cation/H+ antiporter complex subunit F [Verrucomicrobiota bacterium]